VLGRVAEQFLEDHGGIALSWTRPPGGPAAFNTARVLFGQGENALEVALGYMSRPGKPRARELRELFSKRQANRPAPVLLVVLYTGADGQPRAGVVGTSSDLPRDMTMDQAARICRAALEESDRHAAARTAERLLASLDSSLSPGLSNSGLFASHELRNGVPSRSDWGTARRSALPLLRSQGRRLISRLGYEVQPLGSAGTLLTHGGRSRAIAILLEETEVFDRASRRFGTVSPVAHGLMLADRDRLPWLVVVRGTQLRLYPASPDVGVGRRGQAETYAELDLAVLAEQEAGYLTLLFAPAALAPGGTATQILRASENFAADLGRRLRDRIYRNVVPGLALAVGRKLKPKTQAELAEAYHQALLILFRILFLAYAEDRGLLPYSRNTRYDRHAVKTIAREFAADPAMVFDEHAASLWDDMQAVWAAVDQGNAGWDVPAYNGGLFSRDPVSSPSGAALSDLTFTDAEFGPCLRALLVDTGEEGTDGPVDFRSLGVREFSVIYEGLIESGLAISEVNLKLDRNGSHVPADPGDVADIPAGQIHVRGKSGNRKATGTYFTKPFVVEHLLNTALEPAISSHLARVQVLLDHEDEVGAAESFFDFRIADPAMGSGHFLVAAIDRIESKFTAFLSEHPIPSVSNELSLLSQAARAALGEQAANVEIDTGALLRRQISRRCIYGLDLNVTAVELARLSIWIHTCVPGLPLPTLNLAVGNSLAGIGTIEEVLDVLEPQPRPGQVSLFAEGIEGALAVAEARLAQVARTAEATRAEVKEAAEAYRKAMGDAADAKALLDAAVGVRLGVVPLQNGPAEAIAAGNSSSVQARIAGLEAAQFPYLFPEVFLRDRPGFDVLVGNPPWDKVKVEEHQWWSLRFPGLRSMPQKEKNAAIARYRKERPDLLAEYEAENQRTEVVKAMLGKGNFPGLRAATDTDLSLAFAWRFWHLLRQDGHAGIVLPRGILSGRAAEKWRTTILDHGAFEDVTTLSNSKTWMFEDVHPQYTVGLVSIIKGEKHAGQVTMRGPYFSRAEYEHGVTRPPRQLPAGDFTEWADGAPFPLLPHADSLDVFLKLRSHPRLDMPEGDWLFIPLRELHTTDNKAMFDFDLANPRGDLPVLSGASFSLWNPDYGDPYAYAEAREIIDWLKERRRRQVRLTSSAFYGMPAAWAADPSTLPCLHPRIAFRDVGRATDSRTVICSLVPGNIALVHLSPYLFRRRGDAKAEAYLLGILSSIPLDWYARRYVEVHLTAGLLKTFPIPQPQEDDPRRRRVIEIAGRLAAVDGRYAIWATEVGVPVGSVVNRAAKDDLIAELDALVAQLYGLSRSDVEHVFATFHRGWNYQPRLAAVLAYYDRWGDVHQAVRAS
jgi:hypothetical protein